MKKKYRVNLTDEEREELELLISRRSSKSIEVKRPIFFLQQMRKVIKDGRINKYIRPTMLLPDC